MHVLCTGGAGYIGSHTVIHLIQAGYKVSILDNLHNASAECVKRLNEITGQTIKFHSVDMTNEAEMDRIFKEDKIDGVIHYASLKAVGESVEKPLDYYSNNVTGALVLLRVMKKYGCKLLVFSSSATVYQPNEKPLTEDSPIGASNPYGQTKVMIEQILRDLFVSDDSWKISILRYFNPVGAHPSGRIGESPDYPLNLLPYIQQVAVGRREALNVFGKDWPTPDGTGVRDYIHVEDLAEGHIAALSKLNQQSKGVLWIHNLGTGKGVSVIELAKKFEAASGKPIPLKFVERRPGDLATVIADPSAANKDLDWKAKRSIEMACESAWKWQSNNPYGFEAKK